MMLDSFGDLDSMWTPEYRQTVTHAFISTYSMFRKFDASSKHEFLTHDPIGSADFGANKLLITGQRSHSKQFRESVMVLTHLPYILSNLILNKSDNEKYLSNNPYRTNVPNE